MVFSKGRPKVRRTRSERPPADGSDVAAGEGEGEEERDGGGRGDGAWGASDGSPAAGSEAGEGKEAAADASSCMSEHGSTLVLASLCKSTARMGTRSMSPLCLWRAVGWACERPCSSALDGADGAAAVAGRGEARGGTLNPGRDDEEEEEEEDEAEKTASHGYVSATTCRSVMPPYVRTRTAGGDCGNGVAPMPAAPIRALPEPPVPAPTAPTPLAPRPPGVGTGTSHDCGARREEKASFSLACAWVPPLVACAARAGMSKRKTVSGFREFRRVFTPSAAAA